MQSEIAKFLELSDAGVSKILKKLKVKTWPHHHPHPPDLNLGIAVGKVGKRW
jgi:DNA-binding MarR family transcriptional regulator